MEPFREKEAIRRRALEARDRMDPALRSSLGRRVAANLRAMPEYRRARLPLFYVSFRSEVPTHRLIMDRIREGLPVAVPLTDPAGRRLIPFSISDFHRDLAPGYCGILEPRPGLPEVDPSTIDLVVVPGSAFDRRCRRFGYGGGYYDRFLSTAAPQALRVALAFELQLYPSIPAADHDQPMDAVVTEAGIYRCAQQEA